MSANIQHSSAEDRWYTPIAVVNLVREVLGAIDLDPASDEFGNSRVQAARFLSAEDDGLAHEWSGAIFLNPPGGTMVDPTGRSKRPVSRAGAFWSKLEAASHAPGFRHAIFLCFSVEQLSNTQKPGQLSCADFPLVIPSKRLRFDTPSGEPGKQPSHANAIVYMPGSIDRTQEFVRLAHALGRVLLPLRAA